MKQTKLWLSLILAVSVILYISFLISINPQKTIIYQTIATGRSISAQGNLGICIQQQKTYSASITDPTQASIINNTTNETVLISSREPDESFNVTFTARNIRTNQAWYLGNKNISLLENTATQKINTRNLPDGNCVYEFQADILGNKSCNRIFFVEGITVNNQNIPPTFSDFSGSKTTNFSQYSSWVKINDPTLQKPETGTIKWENQTVNFDSANLNSYLQFSNKSLSIDNDHLYCLHNTKVIVTFDNITFIKPTLNNNGADCVATGKCALLNYNKTSDKATFLINSLTGNYQVVENTKGTLNFWYQQTSPTENVSINEPVYFLGNYTANDGNTTYYLGSLSNVYCNITFSYTNQSNYIIPALMNYNQQTELFNYTLSFGTPGRYYVKSNCNAEYYELGKTSKTITIDIAPIAPNITSWSKTNLLNSNGQHYIRYVHQNVSFWVNFTNPNNGAPIANGTCNITFVDGNNQTITLYPKYNSTTSLYQTQYAFLTPGYRTYNVWCSKSPMFGEAYYQGNVTITNRPPIYLGSIDPNKMIPPMKWPEGTIIMPYYLNDYFIDPDGNKLTYNTSLTPNHMTVIISNLSQVTYIPEDGFTGTTDVIFEASDGYGGHAFTQKIPLTVYKLPNSNPNPSSGSSEEPISRQSSDSGFQTSGLNQNPSIINCEENWKCSNWSDCYITRIETRSCTDINNCNTTYNKPSIVQKCTFIPTCHDHLKDGNETGVDCGGPCPACPSCHDDIQNEGETGVDCGGPCPACPSCYDGIQNEGETAIDCGGPCPACQRIETPQVFRTKIEDNLIPISTLITLSVVALLLYLKYHQIIMSALVKLWFLLIAFYLAKLRKKTGYNKEINLSQYLRIRIISLRKGISKLSDENTLEEIMKLTRLLYKKIFGIDYEFTENDLKSSIKNMPMSSTKKNVYTNYFKRISHASYSQEKITKEKVTRWLDILYKLVDISKDLLDYRILEDELTNAKKTNAKKINHITRKIAVKLLKFLRSSKKYLKEKDIKSAIEEQYIIEKTYGLIKNTNRSNQKLNKIKDKIKEYSKDLRNNIKNNK